MPHRLSYTRDGDFRPGPVDPFDTLAEETDPVITHEFDVAPVPAPLVVVMGVAGSGKSTVADALARRLHLPFQDADAHHSPANVDRMSRGIPLADDDRRPWLLAVGDELHRHTASGLVMACSALRVAYRDLLRSRAPETFFVHLDVGREVLAARVAARRAHFMPLSLLDSQLEIVESLTAAESGVVLDGTHPVSRVVDLAQAALLPPR